MNKIRHSVDMRLEWIDQLKFFAIFFVIWGHLSNGDECTFSFIYSFHMNLFIMISGFLFNPLYTNENFFKKNTRSLLVPYWCLGGIVLIYKSILFGNFYSNFIIDYITGDLFWFFPCLYILRIMFNIVFPWLKSSKNIFIFLSFYFIFAPFLSDKTSILAQWHFSYIHDTIYYMPFFIIGYLLKKDTLIMKRNFLRGVIIFSLLYIYIYMFRFTPSRNVDFSYDYIVRFFISIIGSIAAYDVSSILKFCNRKIILVISEGTGFIYPIHMLFVYPFFMFMGNNSQLFVFMVAVDILFLLYFPTNFILSYLPFLAGRRLKRQFCDSL